MTAATDIAALEARVQASPDNEAARADLDRALSAAGEHAAAVETLTKSLRNLTAHEEPTLPCLCRRCLRPEVVEAEAGGVRFVRRFAVARGRVLFFWVPEELASDPGLVRGVAGTLRRRLKPRRDQA